MWIPNWIHWLTGSSGHLPFAGSIGKTLQAAWAHLAQARFAGPHYSYSGPPDVSINPSVTGVFHIIQYMPDRHEASVQDRQYGLQMLEWPVDQTTHGDIVAHQWSADFPGGPGYITLKAYAGGHSAAAVAGDFVHPDETETFYNGVEYDPNDGSGQWLHTAYRFEFTMSAAFAGYELPVMPTTEEQMQINPGDVSQDQIIRGYDSTEDTGSLGTLLHNIGDGADPPTYENLEFLSRRCLFQTGHPIGIWHEFTSPSWIQMFGSVAKRMTFPVKLRNLRERTGHTVECYPAIVLDATDDAVSVRFNTSTDSWTFTTSGAVASPTLYKYSDGIGNTTGAGGGILIDGDGEDHVWVDARSTGSNEEILLQTVTLFEGPEYP